MQTKYKEGNDKLKVAKTELSLRRKKIISKQKLL